MIDDIFFAQYVGLNSPDFIFAFWGVSSLGTYDLILFFRGLTHLGAPQGDYK